MLTLTDDYFRLDEEVEDIDLNEEYNLALLEVNHYVNLIEEAILVEKHINFLYYLQEADETGTTNTPTPQATNNTGGAPDPSSNAKVPQPKQSVGGKIKDFFKKIWEAIVLFFQKFRKNVEGYLINKQIKNLEAKLAQFPKENKSIEFSIYHDPKNADGELGKIFNLLPLQLFGKIFSSNKPFQTSNDSNNIAIDIKKLAPNSLGKIEISQVPNLNDEESVKKAIENFNKLKEELKNKEVENEIERKVLNGKEGNPFTIKSIDFKSATETLLENINKKLRDLLSLNNGIENVIKRKNYEDLDGNKINNAILIKFYQATFSLYSWLITFLIKLIKKVLNIMMKEATIFVSGKIETTEEPSKAAEETTATK